MDPVFEIPDMSNELVRPRALIVEKKNHTLRRKRIKVSGPLSMCVNVRSQNTLGKLLDNFSLNTNLDTE